MFISFFLDLRRHGINTSITEYLHLLEGLDRRVIGNSIEDFFYLCRTALIKQEGQLDLFDQLFGQYFRNMVAEGDFWEEIPEEWLRSELERLLSPEEIARIESMGGLDALIARFRELMEEQEGPHGGGNRMIGSGGTSPFGSGGFNPEGFRIGQNRSRHRNAIKVWDRREYANLDDQAELDTRNLKMVLKSLRMLTREGVPDELDLKGTIRRTSENGGMLDLHMIPSRKNRVKILLLLDIGGSMDDHVELCSRLFSAARHEFKHLEYYYFHNCLYEYVWKDNRRRHQERIPTWQLIHKYNSDYKLIFVGDAAMSPIEIMYRGGSVEHWNEEPGMAWLQRMKEQFPDLVWLNPNPEYYWPYYESTAILRRFTQFRMFPMTIQGIRQAMKCLKDSSQRYGSESDLRTHR